MKRFAWFAVALTMLSVVLLVAWQGCSDVGPQPPPPGPSPPGPEPPPPGPLPPPDPKPPIDEFSGKVIKVVDGDTLVVRKRIGQRYTVDILGIDCPELSQPYGPEAKAYLKGIADGRKVDVYAVRGEGGKTLTASMMLKVEGEYVDPEKEYHLDIAMVKDGWAWHDPVARDETPWLIIFEKYARARKLGLWADADPVPPWEWRKRQ